MTRHDELVEEMYDALSRFAGHIVRYQASGDRHAEHECKMAHVHAFIAATLKAVVDGSLDEVLGVVGRGKLTRGEVLRHPVYLVEPDAGQRSINIGVYRFIALRPEETSEFPHFEPDEPSFIAEIH